MILRLARKAATFALGGFGAYVYDVHIRRFLVMEAARSYCNRVGKPLLNVGSGTERSALFGATVDGDVNIDIEAPNDAPCGPGKVCWGDAHDLRRFRDKHFGAVVASHVLEHLKDPDRALAEWHRVADQVHVLVPQWWDPATFLPPGHKWWFPQGPYGRKVCLYRCRE